MGTMMSAALFLAERGYAPDALIRTGIRQLCRRRLSDISSPNEYVRASRLENLIDTMNRSDIALSPDMANQQHYELPHTFFEMILGSHRKYSCGYWQDDINDLACSEQRALQLTCEHADIRDGDQILELGCGCRWSLFPGGWLCPDSARHGHEWPGKSPPDLFVGDIYSWFEYWSTACSEHAFLDAERPPPTSCGGDYL